MPTINPGCSSAPTVQFGLLRRKKEYDLEKAADVLKMINDKKNAAIEKENTEANQKKYAEELAASYNDPTDAACKALVQTEKTQVQVEEVNTPAKAVPEQTQVQATEANTPAQVEPEKQDKKYDILPLATRFTELMAEKKKLDKSERTSDTKARRALVEKNYTTILAVLSGQDTKTAGELSKDDQEALINSLNENSGNIDKETSAVFSKILGKRLEYKGERLEKSLVSSILSSAQASGALGIIVFLAGVFTCIAAPPIGLPIMAAALPAASTSPVAKLVNAIYHWRTGKNLGPFRKAQ